MTGDDAIAEVKARVAGLIAPIDGGVGEDLSYDEAFEAVKAEIDKSSQIDGGTTDWKNVEDLTSDLLTNRTKDFRLALYWAVARLQRDGFTGLFEGIVVMNELDNAFWEPMYPALRRPRARGNLLGWFTELATPVVQGANPTPQQRATVEGLGKAFPEFDSFLSEKLGEACPPMMGLAEVIRSLVRRAPIPVEEKAPASVPPRSMRSPASMPPDAMAATPADGSPAAGGGFSVTIVDVDSAYLALAQVKTVIATACDALFASNATSVDGYRLGLQAAWIMIGGDPENDGSKTKISGPSDQWRQTIGALVTASDWNGVINNAWTAIQENPYWLDAPRALARALGSISPPQPAAQKVVETEVAAVLARAPNLAALAFSDGTPLADDDTRAWISGLGSGGGGPVKAASPVDKAAADANKLAVDGNLPAALAVLSKATQTTSPVDRFRARLEIAKLAIQQQLYEMAKAQLETLERSAEEHQLASWDPALCADLLAHLYKVRRVFAQSGSMDDPDIGKKLAQSFQRLCELDAARAFQVMSEG